VGARPVRSYRRVHDRVRSYAVFARRARADALRHVGSVVAPDDDLARVYARATYDEERWIEMMIVPEEQMLTVWAPGAE
jgi:1,2-phenylacetyl-CoA epoxidase PaaB subunit